MGKGLDISALQNSNYADILPIRGKNICLSIGYT